MFMLSVTTIDILLGLPVWGWSPVLWKGGTLSQLFLHDYGFLDHHLLQLNSASTINPNKLNMAQLSLLQIQCYKSF